MVRREVRVQGEPEDPAFVPREDVGQDERGLGLQLRRSERCARGRAAR